MNLYDKFIYEYTTGRRTNPNLLYRFKNEDEQKVLNIGSLVNYAEYGVTLKKRLYGKILDVGAAIGRHSRLLPNTYSIDSSKPCCDYMRNRGFPHVIEGDIFNHHDKYDSLILTMNNIGMTGDYDRTIELIYHLKSLLNEKGQIIFDYNSESTKTKVKEYSWLDDDGNKEDESHIWTFLCEENIREIAKKIGMHFEVILTNWSSPDDGFNLGRFYYDDTRFEIHATSRSGHNHFIETLKSWYNGINIVNMENSKTTINENKKNIIFIRDYLNMLASISNFNHPKIEDADQTEYIERILKSAIKSWEFLFGETLTGNTDTVFYEKFISDKEYRENVCKLINGEYNESQINELPQFTPASSFDDKNFNGRASQMKVNDRWKMIQDDEESFKLFVGHLRNNLPVLALYLENYVMSKEKLNFLYKHITTGFNVINQATDINKLSNPLNFLKDLINESGNFLDLGCGLGNVMLLAKKIYSNYKIIGVDNNRDYINLVKNYDSMESHCMDILSNETNKLISESDVVYAYHPLHLKELIILFNNLSQHMKKDSYFIYNSEHNEDLVGFNIIKNYPDDNSIGAPQHITIYQKQ